MARQPPGPLPLNTGTANSPTRTQTVITAAIIALVLIAIVALADPSFTVHFLFSPWLLVAIAVLAWIKFRPRRPCRAVARIGQSAAADDGARRTADRRDRGRRWPGGFRPAHTGPCLRKLLFLVPAGHLDLGNLPRGPEPSRPLARPRSGDGLEEETRNTPDSWVNAAGSAGFGSPGCAGSGRGSPGCALLWRRNGA